MEGYSSFFSISDVFVSTRRSPHDDIEPLGSILYDSKHLFIVSARKIRLEYFNVHSEALSEGAYPI